MGGSFEGVLRRSGMHFSSVVAQLVDHPQDDPLLLWRAKRDLFLEEFIRLEGRGATANDRCELCRKEGTHRCLDCIAIRLLCTGCLSRVHSFNPFHAVEVC